MAIPSPTMEAELAVVITPFADTVLVKLVNPAVNPPTVHVSPTTVAFRAIRSVECPATVVERVPRLVFIDPIDVLMVPILVVC